MKLLNKINAYWVTMCALILGLGLIRAARLPELDVLWGAVNGTDILKGISITAPVDYWNFQTVGETWSPNSWLWHVLLGSAYNIFGTLGFWIIVFLSNIAILFLAWVYLIQNKVTRAWHPYLVLGFSILTILFLNGRSNTVDVLLCLIFLTSITRFMKLKNKKWAWLATFTVAFVLSVLWINFHLTGVLATILFPAFTWIVLRREPIKTRILLPVGIFVVTAVGNICSPFGLTAYSKMFLVRDESTGLISEWGPVIQPYEIFWLHILGIILTIVAILFLWKIRQEILYSLFLLLLTIQSVLVSRYAMYLVIALFVIVPVFKWSAPVKAFPAKLFLLAGRMIASVVLLIGFVVNIMVLVDNDSYFPVAVSDFSYIPDGSNVLASQHSGSALILYRPDTLVALDGRNDLIGKERMITPYQMFFSEDDKFVEDWFAEHKVDVVFLDKDQDDNATPLVNRLEHWGWERIETERSLIFVDKQ